MLPPTPSPESVAQAVQAYNERFGALDVQLRVAALEAIHSLYSADSLSTLENFVWNVKRWGAIQGTWTSDRVAMGRALLDLNMVMPET